MIVLTDDYFIGQFHITRKQFGRFVDETGYKTEAEQGDGGRGWNEQQKEIEGPNKKFSWKDPGFTQTDEHPVVNATWNDAKKFCDWLSKKGNGRVHIARCIAWRSGMGICMPSRKPRPILFWR